MTLEEAFLRTFPKYELCFFYKMLNLGVYNLIAKTEYGYVFMLWNGHSFSNKHPFPGTTIWSNHLQERFQKYLFQNKLKAALDDAD